jgi:hypothetical protein
MTRSRTSTVPSTRGGLLRSMSVIQRRPAGNVLIASAERGGKKKSEVGHG